jgi:hypothetical protein
LLLPQGGAAGTTFIMPSAEAWAQFEADAKKQRVNMTDAKLDALFSYLLTRVPVSSAALQKGAAVPMNLAAKDQKKALRNLCPKSKSKATIVFAVDQQAKQSAAAAAPPMAPAAGMGGGMGADDAMAVGSPDALGGSSDTLGAAPPMPTGRAGMGGFGAGAGAEQPTLGAAPMGAAPQQRMQQNIPGLGPLRRLLQAAAGTKKAAAPAPAAAAAEVEEEIDPNEDPSAFTGLLLPTTYQARADPATPGTGIAAAGGCVWLLWGKFCGGRSAAGGLGITDTPPSPA